MPIRSGRNDGAPQRAKGGFCLLEAILATVLVAIGITALVIATQSSTEVNAAGRDLTQAIYLAQEIRERTLKLPFSDLDPDDQGNPPGADASDLPGAPDDLDDLMGLTYSPPRDADGAVVTDLAGWSQHITLEWKDPDSLCTTVPDGGSNIISVNVTVALNGKTVLETRWLVGRRQSE